MKADRSEFVPIRGVRYHVRRRGNTDTPAMLLLRGQTDMSANFQFIADSLQQEWNVITPDWRQTIIQESGHNVHHEYPEQLAALTEAYFASLTAPSITTRS